MCITGGFGSESLGWHEIQDIYAALAIKWRGLLFIRQPGPALVSRCLALRGIYRFQITCMGAAELRRLKHDLDA